MREWQSHAHVKWYCRYHLVIKPKYHRKPMFGVFWRNIVEILKELCRRFEVEVVEGHVMLDHVHMCLGIQPKFSVAHAIGKLKGKSTILLHQKYGHKLNFIGLTFWSRGYCISTVGLDEAMVKKYIRTQGEREKRKDQIDS